jgi:hypothetical protein
MVDAAVRARLDGGRASDAAAVGAEAVEVEATSVEAGVCEEKE